MAWYSANIKTADGKTQRYHFEYSGDGIRAKALLEQRFGKGSVFQGVSSHGISKPPSHATIITIP